MAIKKTALYSSLWASCDQLRGGMDASQYKDYVLFMLFIKYISDKYAGSSAPFAPVKIPKGAGFADMVALKGKSDIGDRINKEIIQPLIDANNKLMRSDFPDFNDANKLGEGKAMVDRLSNLIAIFEKPELDFSKNRAEDDDLLGDAYEYLMRHFATQSGKSKGQFYTPAEVSRVMAKVIGIAPHNTTKKTSAYDPTCGSGSLLLKVAAEAEKEITLEGQENDVSTAGLARMNMMLHGFNTANIQQGDTIVAPKFLKNDGLKTYDYVVANPPFSDKAWSTGFDPAADKYRRFSYGVPPHGNGDYAYLLHIVHSLNSTGKGACILPHGALFRGNAEAAIRENLVRSGVLSGIIGLPANLFYGTGIPACIVVLDKENAKTRKGIFMIDAAQGFAKDGAKNRLRERDIHKITATFRQRAEVPRYARMVSLAEIEANGFNLNLPRYIDSSTPEDVQDISAHMFGGIPARDVDAFAEEWQQFPALRRALFVPADRAGYLKLAVPPAELKSRIVEAPEFADFRQRVQNTFDDWVEAHYAALRDFAQGSSAKALMHTLSEDLLARFQTLPLLDAYGVYQHFMDYWADSMQDDCDLIAAVGWAEAAQAREIEKIKNGKGKLVWPKDSFDYTVGSRRFTSDLIPAQLLENRYFVEESAHIAALRSQAEEIGQAMQDMVEEYGGEEGLFSALLEDEELTVKSLSAKVIKARLDALNAQKNLDDDERAERAALAEYAALLKEQDGCKKALKAAEKDLNNQLAQKYPALSEREIQELMIDDKWLATLAGRVRQEPERIAQHLGARLRELAERYAKTLPEIEAETAALTARVQAHLKHMGAQ